MIHRQKVEFNIQTPQLEFNRGAFITWLKNIVSQSGLDLEIIRYSSKDADYECIPVIVVPKKESAKINTAKPLDQQIENLKVKK